MILILKTGNFRETYNSAMPYPVQTYIYCLDDHRAFSEDVRKRFSDSTRYTVSISHNRDDLLKILRMEKDNKYCKVIIIGLNDSKENFDMAENLVVEIKNLDINTGIILLVPPEKLDEARKSIRINIDSYVPRNPNSVLRIHNTVKKLISQHNLLFYRKKRAVSLYTLIAFIVASVVLALIAWLRLPMYF